MILEGPFARNKALRRLRELVGKEIVVFFNAEKSERGFLDSYNMEGTPFIILVCYDRFKMINLRYVMLIEEITENE